MVPAYGPPLAFVDEGIPDPAISSPPLIAPTVIPVALTRVTYIAP